MSDKLTREQLRWAYILGVNLWGQNFANTNLKGICLVEGDFLRSNFSLADCKNADFSMANLKYTNFHEANCENTNLSMVNCAHALFTGGANLTGANFLKAICYRTNFQDAILVRVTFIMVDLREANLSGTNLSGAYLSGANLSGANLSGANLSGAILSGANLTGANLTQIIVDTATITDDSCLNAIIRPLFMNVLATRFHPTLAGIVSMYVV